METIKEIILYKKRNVHFYVKVTVYVILNIYVIGSLMIKSAYIYNV